MTEQSQLGVTSAPPDTGASTAVDSPSIQGAESHSSDNVTTTPPVQEQTASEDPLAGVPSIEEAQGMDTVSKEAFLSVRGAYDKVKPQFDEITQKYSVFSPFADRFEKPEELQELVDLKDKLFGYERDDSNQLIPSTQNFAQYVTEKYPQHADFLTADLLDQPTLDPETGRQVPRIELALEAMKDDPARRAKALQILGGVEPTSIAPTWQPTEAELNAFVGDPNNLTPQEKALQDIYRSLPYEDREELKLNSPEFIRKQLEKEQFHRNIVEENRKAQELQQQQEQQRQRYFQQQAQEAGNKFVEEGFRQGMTEFANSIVERTKFISPIDPQSPEAQQLGPQGVQEMNAKIERINRGVGSMVAVVTAALAVPDTSWAVADFLKGIGVDEKVLSAYDQSRLEYARNARDYGELNFSSSQNGQGQQGLGILQANARKAMNAMKGHGNAVAGPLLSLLSDFFEMKANSHNQTLNGRPAVRPPVNGNGYDPTTASDVRQPRDPSDAWNPERTIDRFLPR